MWMDIMESAGLKAALKALSAAPTHPQEGFEEADGAPPHCQSKCVYTFKGA
jgi:hypothetical protein